MDIAVCFRDAWAAYKREPLISSAATVIYAVGVSLVGAALGASLGRVRGAGWLLSGVPTSMLLFGPVFVGLAHLASKALGGRSLSMEDLAFPTQRVGDALLIGLIVAAGLVLCGVGVILTSFLFLFAPLYVVKGDGYADALRKSKDLVTANLGDVLLLYVVVWLLALPAAVTCGLLSVVTFPLGYLMIVRAHDQLTASAPPAV
jgi:hypothetical protein